MATIYIIKGPNNGSVYRISNEPCVVGRSDSCSVKLDDDRVSGSHLRFSFDADSKKFMAVDEKSTNGSWINGKSLSSTPVVLNDGDKIELGTTMIEFSNMDFDSIDAAKAARDETKYAAPPTMMESQNRKF